ncbi:hypothetical protein tb265_34260 [Gemmatimonadetes bacterium T265]|nr:hypothetical protein tb265_34260 [Gemmatimonadetes bacterium T265]
MRPASGVTEGTRIPVRPKRAVRAAFLAQLTQHLPAVLTVLAAGASAVRSEREGGALALAAAELLVGAWVLVVIVVEARHVFGRHAVHDATTAVHESSWIDVPGVAAAALGYVEVWHHAVERGHFKLVSPFMLGATSTLVLALGGRRLIANRMRHRRPHLLVTRNAVTYRARRRHRWAAAWDDVAAVEHESGELRFRMQNGATHVVRAADHLGGDGLIAAARLAVAEHAPARLARAEDAVTARNDGVPAAPGSLSRS